MLFRSAVFDKIMDGVHNDNKRNIEGQVSLFDSIYTEIEEDNLPNLREFAQKTLLTMEKEILGIYISGHPLAPYEDELKAVSNITTTELFQMTEGVDGEVSNIDLIDGKNVTIGGIIVFIKNKITKNNNMMAFVTIEDLLGSIEVIVFPKTYDRYLKHINEDNIVVVQGKVSSREEEEPKIICEKITPLKSFKSGKLYIKISSEKSLNTFDKLKRIFAKYSGDSPVYIYIEREDKVVMADRNLWVDIGNEQLLNELKNVVGKNCVKVC